MLVPPRRVRLRYVRICMNAAAVVVEVRYAHASNVLNGEENGCYDACILPAGGLVGPITEIYGGTPLGCTQIQKLGGGCRKC